MNRNPMVEQDVVGITSQDLPWDEFTEKTDLISGANGFLPAYMVETVTELIERFLCSNAPSWIIGADHVMNGGRTSC